MQGDGRLVALPLVVSFSGCEAVLFPEHAHLPAVLPLCAMQIKDRITTDGITQTLQLQCQQGNLPQETFICIAKTERQQESFICIAKTEKSRWQCLH
jgi:hypothetical protein